METSVSIEAPAAAAWNLLIDTRRWPEWGPSVSAVSCGERYIASGSSGWVTTVVGLKLPFRITEFTPGFSWAWKVSGIQATSHRIEPVGADRCRLIFWVPFWAAPYLGICRLAEERIKRILEEEQSL